MNQSATMEALLSATYLDDYLQCVDKLPDDVQRTVTQLRELDLQTNEILTKVAVQRDSLLRQDESTAQKKSSAAVQELHRNLVRMREMGDMKLALVARIIEQIEQQSRQLDQDLENLDPGSAGSNTAVKDEELLSSPLPTSSQPKASVTASLAVMTTATSSNDSPSLSSTSANNLNTSTVKSSRQQDDKSEESSSKTKRHRRKTIQEHLLEPATPAAASTTIALSSTSSFANPVTVAAAAPIEDDKKSEDERPKKKKPKRSEKADKSPVNKLAIDPNEPKYCLCNQISYGEMIGCDNQQCSLEWFHFNCVNLVHKPKGKWFCPECRGDRPNIMNPDLVDQLRKDKTTKSGKKGTAVSQD